MRYVRNWVLVASVCVLSACSGSGAEPTDEASRDAVYDKAIENNQFVKAMCMRWGAGATSQKPIALCDCQTKLENSALDESARKEREAFFKKTLENYARVEGTDRDNGFGPYFKDSAARYANLSNQGILEFLKVLNPANFDVELDSKIKDKCDHL